MAFKVMVPVPEPVIPQVWEPESSVEPGQFTLPLELKAAEAASVVDQEATKLSETSSGASTAAAARRP